MTGSVTGTVYQLSVPAGPASLGYIRLFGGAVARRHGISDDEWLEDFKLILSEAASFALGAGELVVGLSRFVDGFECSVGPAMDFAPSGVVPDPYEIVVGLAAGARVEGDRIVILVNDPS